MSFWAAWFWSVVLGAAAAAALAVVATLLSGCPAGAGDPAGPPALTRDGGSEGGA